MTETHKEINRSLIGVKTPDSDHLNVTHSERQELLDTFKASSVGRGIWYIQHVMSASIIKQVNDIVTTSNKLMTVYMTFIVYCRFIYCGFCRNHAAEQIQRTSISSEIQNPNRNTPFLLFRWFYNFHKAANAHAKKKSPTEKDVVNYFMYDIKDGPIKDSDFSYKKIQCGMWHYFFLLASKCHSHEQISCIYFIMLEFMPHLQTQQRNIFISFCSKHRFTEALNDFDLPNEQLCISFFDWIYAMYAEMQTDAGIKVYDIDLVKDVYFNLESCNKDCEH